MPIEMPQVKYSPRFYKPVIKKICDGYLLILGKDTLCTLTGGTLKLAQSLIVGRRLSLASGLQGNFPTIIYLCPEVPVVAILYTSRSTKIIAYNRIISLRIPLYLGANTVTRWHGPKVPWVSPRQKRTQIKTILPSFQRNLVGWCV